MADIIDILLVALMIYYLFRLIKGTAALKIVSAIISLYVLWIVLRALNMKLTSSILGQVLGVGVVALIVIFQPEIRRFLLHIGDNYLSGKGNSFLRRLRNNRAVNSISSETLEEITSACREMSDSGTGALIVLRHDGGLEDFIETGDRIDAAIKKRLIENIFFKNSPLHDGALIMDAGRMIAARCTLPMSNTHIPANFGMRHRAAVGVTEETDADAIVVSEETGDIHFVSNGHMQKIESITELRLLIQDSYTR
ncbi:MAG: diadenylate cyclase CdaA [Bacteroidales bacterium]|nr:diadenylate cyclase CdaA [Bacteroidales bacterium]